MCAVFLIILFKVVFISFLYIRIVNKINSMRKVMRFSYVAMLSALVFFIQACQNRKNGTLASTEATSKNKNEEKVVVKPAYVLDAQPYQPTETLYHDLLHTKLKVSFDWKKQYLYGRAELTLTPYFYSQKSLQLDAKGFDIHTVELLRDGIDALPLEYAYIDSLVLDIKLDKEYKKGEHYVIYIEYTAKPNEIKAQNESHAITDDKGLYFINPLGEDSTKPRQIWTQGETESSSCWFPTIDQPNEKTTQEIAITVDKEFVTLSNGILEFQMENEDGTRTDYWAHSKPHAPYLFMMAVGEFAVIYDEWLMPESGEKLEVNYYVEKDFEPYAKKIFGHTPEMLGFFSKKLGYEFPWQKYSQIVVRDYVSGAMENTTASLFMNGLQLTDRELLDKNWDYIIAHELFHQWFGDLVTCESWGNLALNESFANYSEYLWYEYKFGKDYADAHRQSEVEDYLNESEKKQVPIIRSNYAHRMDMFDSHSYAKGGVVLHMLRNQLGDEAFFASLKHYLHKNEYTDVEIHELRLAFEEVTGLDLNQFFNQWFLNPGHPQLLVEQEYVDGELKVKITQQQDSLYTQYFTIPTFIEVFSGDEKQSYPVTIRGKETVFNLKLDKAPLYVLLDPEQVILAEIEHDRIYEENIKIYNESRNYQARYNALDQLVIDFANTNYGLRTPEDLEKAGVSVQRVDSINTLILNTFIQALSDPSEHIKTYALETLKSYDLKRVNDLRLKYKEMIVSDSASSNRAQAVVNLGALVTKETAKEDEVQVFKQAVNDSSYLVMGEALLVGMTLDIPGTDSVIQKYMDSDKANIIKAIGKYFIKTKNTQKDQWLIDAFNKVDGGDLIGLIDVFSGLTSITQADSQKRLIEFFHERGINGKDIYTRYTSYRILNALHKIEGVNDLRQDLIAKEKSAMLLGVYKSWEDSIKK